MKTLSRTVLTLFVLFFSCLAAIAGEVSFKITRQYLNFPISHKENRGRMTFEVNGKPDLSVWRRMKRNTGCLKMCRLSKERRSR